MAKRRTTGDHLFAVRLMEHLVVPTFVLDANGRVLIWNRACERLTGLPAAEVIGTADHWRGFYDRPRACLADLVLHGDAGSLTELYAEHASLDEGRVDLSAENWCVMPRLGSRRYLAIDAGPIYDETGKLLAVVETLRDITAQREAQVALQALAHRDGLTGLANRRSFDERLAQGWRRAQRDGQPISLLMIDIDHFKEFNDAAGHQAGDECLRRIAASVASVALRPDDHAARYGGEEFAVILPNTSIDGAGNVADRIAAAVRSAAIAHPGSGVDGTVTVSVGAACAAKAVGEAASLVALADAALYRAKREGRDRVVRSTAEPDASVAARAA